MRKIKVLFLASNPKDTDRLALDVEMREISSKIRAAEYRDSIDLVSAWAVRPDDLIQMLNQHRPQIVHFSGHGSESGENILTGDSGELEPVSNRNLRPPIVHFSSHGNNSGEIILTGDNGEPKPVSKEALISLFTTLKDNIKVVFLNCCYSKEQAKAITQVIDCAVGMNSAIGDKAAITFAASFYRAVGFGRSVQEAFDQGITALRLERIPEENKPELLVKDGVDPYKLIPLGVPGYINMAPDLESGFIQRNTEYEQLVEGLLNNQNNSAATSKIALRGAGGFGKTTLAKAVCHDPDVVKKFSDGILWVTLGEKPKNLIGHIQDLIYRLSDKRPDFEGLDATVSYFKDLLNEKSILLVIDDVWNSSHLEPFIQGGTKCVRLITTRIKDVLPAGTLEVRLDTMKNEESANLLRSGLSCALSGTDDQKIKELAKRLGYWPLLLKMANSALKQYIERGKSFEETLDHINHKLDKKNLTAFDPKDPQKRNLAVEATINVSFDLLDKDEFERFEELAIFPEDEEVHLETIEKLWGKTADYDDFDVEELCYKLFNLSLLQTYDGNKKTVKLHDVMREYLNEKQQKKIPSLHSLFLEAYEVEMWADLPIEETYLWRNLAYHLVEAERKEELRKLLFDFNWIKSKLNATDVHLLINDYNFFHDDYPVQMVKGAIQLSANALSKDKKLLDGQLLGRLELISDNEIMLLLRNIREHKNCISILPLTCSLMPPGGPLLRTLEGHSDTVYAVSITSDGNYGISASYDQTVKVWDLKKGEEIWTLRGHSKGVTKVSITHDGNNAISSDDRTLKVWDLKTGKEIKILIIDSISGSVFSITPDRNYAVSDSSLCDGELKVWKLKTGIEIHTLTDYSKEVSAVYFTRDRNFAVSAYSDNTFKVWDLKKGEQILLLKDRSIEVTAVSITSNKNYAVSAYSDNIIRVWNLDKGEEVRTLRGHLDRVNAISITYDGNYAASASDDKTVKIWNLKKGEEIWTLRGHSKGVTKVSIFSKEFAFSASSDNTPIAWDLKTGKSIMQFKIHLENFDKFFDQFRDFDTNPVNYGVHEVSVTLDGNYAISASYENINVWDLKKGIKIHTLKAPYHSYIIAFTITSDGNYAVSAYSNDTLKVWDLKKGEEIWSVKNYLTTAIAISITSDGNYVVSASVDVTLKVWNLKTGEKINTLTGHSKEVSAISITSNGIYAVSASYDHTLKVWDLKKGEEVLTLRGHSRGVTAVSTTLDGNYAVSASYDHTLKVWDLKTRKIVHILTGHLDSVNAVSLTSDGNYAVSASSDNTLKVWDLKTRKIVHILTGHLDSVNAVAITSDGNYAVSASNDKTIKVWNLKTGKEYRTIYGHIDKVNAVLITPDGNYAVSASYDKTFKVWNIKTGKKVRALKDHSNMVTAFSVSPDGNYAVSASSNNTLKVWDLNTGNEVNTLEGHSGMVTAVSITPKGNYVVSASKDRTLKVWDLKTGKEIRSLTGHLDLVNAVSVTPDGHFVVSASSDNTLKVWDLKTGKEVHTLKGHSRGVNAVSVTPDGNYAVSASYDNTLKVWDLKTGKELANFCGESPVLSVVFSQDSNIIVAGELSGRVHFLQFERGSEY